MFFIHERKPMKTQLFCLLMILSKSLFPSSETQSVMETSFSLAVDKNPGEALQTAHEDTEQENCPICLDTITKHTKKNTHAQHVITMSCCGKSIHYGCHAKWIKSKGVFEGALCPACHACRHYSDTAINAAFRGGNTLMHIAVIKRQTGRMKDLWRSGADLDGMNDQGLSPFHWAVKYGELDAMLILKELGADTNCLTKQGLSPIHLAALCNQVSSVCLLAGNAFQVDINATTSLGFTALHFASARADLRTISVLIELGSDIHAKTHLAHTPLLTAILFNKLNVVSFFINTIGLSLDEQQLKQLLYGLSRHFDQRELCQLVSKELGIPKPHIKRMLLDVLRQRQYHDLRVTELQEIFYPSTLPQSHSIENSEGIESVNIPPIDRRLRHSRYCLTISGCAVTGVFIIPVVVYMIIITSGDA